MAHPLATLIVGIKTRFEMREAGYDRSEIREAVGKLIWGHVEQAVKLAGPEAQAAFAAAPPMPAEGVMLAAGDHPFIDWLIAFVNSDLGKAVVQILIMLLMGFLTPAPTA